MDIQSLGFIYSQTKETGRKPYSPIDMFKLYTYGYFSGIRSSRKLERECYRNIDVIWLINELKPDFKTIADFRKDNKKQIKLAFNKFSMICDELGLIGKELVAIDGSKFRASNSRMAYHSENKLQKKIEHYNKTAEQYLLLLDSCDNEERNCSRINLSRAEIESKIQGINKRLSELETLKEFVKENGSIYITDPDSRMMKTNNNGVDICPHRKQNARFPDHKRYQNFSACSECRVKEKCSDSEKGRTIQDRPFQRYADEVDKRTNEYHGFDECICCS